VTLTSFDSNSDLSILILFSQDRRWQMVSSCLLPLGSQSLVPSSASLSMFVSDQRAWHSGRCVSCPSQHSLSLLVLDGRGGEPLLTGCHCLTSRRRRDSGR